jgi:hypothetical protein
VHYPTTNYRAILQTLAEHEADFIGKETAMTTMTAIVRNGRLELPKPLDLPDGTEIQICLPGPEDIDPSSTEEGPMSPEEIARVLAAMEKVEPLEMTDEERAALEADRRSRKEWEKAHFEERAEKVQRAWE